MKQGDYIRILFKERNLKIKDVAKELNITPNSLSLKIAGKRQFKPDEINYLVTKLNLPYESIFQVDVVRVSNKENVIIDGEKYFISKKTKSEILDIITKEVI